MKTEDKTFPPELLNITLSLANNLASSQPFTLYRQAQSRLDGDLTAQTLIKNISLAQADLRKRRGTDEINQADIDQLRALQNEAQVNPVLMDYSRAQQNAVVYLKEINHEISQLIGVDFAALARRSCCG